MAVVGDVVDEGMDVEVVPVDRGFRKSVQVHDCVINVHKSFTYHGTEFSRELNFYPGWMYPPCSRQIRSLSGKPACQQRSKNNHWPYRHLHCCLRNVCDRATRCSLRLTGSISHFPGRLGISCHQDNRHGRVTMFRRSPVLLRDRSRFCGRRAQMGYLTYPTSDLSHVTLKFDRIN
jgi:hypothetical protein